MRHIDKASWHLRKKALSRKCGARWLLIKEMKDIRSQLSGSHISHSLPATDKPFPPGYNIAP